MTIAWVNVQTVRCLLWPEQQAEIQRRLAGVAITGVFAQSERCLLWPEHLAEILRQLAGVAFTGVALSLFVHGAWCPTRSVVSGTSEYHPSPTPSWIERGHVWIERHRRLPPFSRRELLLPHAFNP